MRTKDMTETSPLPGARRLRAGSPEAAAPEQASPPAEQAFIENCRRRSIELLKRNLSPAGILAATPSPHARRRGYTSIFGRDAAVCAIAMALSDDRILEHEAATGLQTLALHQAPNGQIPKFVDVHAREADFWYLGCIDSTLWWLLAIAFLDAQGRPAIGPALRKRHAAGIAKAIQWLLAQEHQRFFLLQQNEASDWADIMPRSGFVLYTNALWYCVKRLYAIEHTERTRSNFNALFHPFSGKLAEYRRARLLNNYVRRQAKNRELYLSFVNFSFFGEEGDVFGNVLAVLLGLADSRARERTLGSLTEQAVSNPYPVRVVTHPLTKRSLLWRPYMERHRQNYAWQYHNGGIWPMVGGFWIAALVECGRHSEACAELLKLARACALRKWAFAEWLHGRTFAPRGMPGQSWNAAGFLIAQSAVLRRANPLSIAVP